MEKIKASDGSTIAIVVTKDFNRDGMNFLTQETSPLQLGVNSYKKGHIIKGHLHPKRKLTVNNIQEVIYLKSGSAIVKLYDLKKNFIKSIALSAGDLIFFANGGHSFEMIDDTTFIEVKQGPYLGNGEDKELLE